MYPSGSRALSRRSKLFYGVGDTSFSLTVTVIGAYFAIFLTDVVGIPGRVAAIAVFIGKTWDYVNDPLVGYLSDRTRTRWGRRRPFLLFAAVPMALTFTMMWYRPPLESNALLAVYFAVAYVLFETASTFAYVPYVALTPELTSDYDERTSLTGYRMLFSIFASLLAFTLPSTIVGGFQPEHATRVLAMGALFGAVSIGPLLATFFGTTERREYLAQPPPKLRASLKAAVRNKPFVFSMAIFLLTWVSVDIIQASLLYYIKYVVVREGQSDVLMASIFVTAMVSLPLWNWVSRRQNKVRAFIWGTAFWAVVQMVIMSLGSATPMAGLVAVCVLAGIGVGAAHVLPWSIIPDAIEWDEYHTGSRHEGMFYSLVTLAQKIASSVAIPLALAMLDWSGYVPNAESQPISSLRVIRVLVGPVPAVLLCVAIIFALLYPLDRDTFARIRSELNRRR